MATNQGIRVVLNPYYAETKSYKPNQVGLHQMNHQRAPVSSFNNNLYKYRTHQTQRSIDTVLYASTNFAKSPISLYIS